MTKYTELKIGARSRTSGRVFGIRGYLARHDAEERARRNEFDDTRKRRKEESRLGWSAEGALTISSAPKGDERRSLRRERLNFRQPAAAKERPNLTDGFKEEAGKNPSLTRRLPEVLASGRHLLIAMVALRGSQNTLSGAKSEARQRSRFGQFL